MSDSPDNPNSWKELRAAVADWGGIIGLIGLVGGWVVWGIGLMPLSMILILSGAFGMLALLGFMGQFRASRAEGFLSLGALKPPLPVAPEAPVLVKPAPTKPNVRFVRAGIEHINLLDGIPRKIKTASEQGEVAVVAVFESEFADTEVRATITFNDPGNTQVDRALWLYEKTHVAKLKGGSRKELVLGYHNPQIGFVCVENDYERDREIKHKLLRGHELIAEVRLLGTKPVEAERHRFKIIVEPSLSVEKIDDESETFSEADRVQHSFDVMSADQVPIGRTVVHQDNAYIRQTFRRTAVNEGKIENVDPHSGKLVLSIKVGVFSGPQVIEYLDLEFWTITVDDQRVTELPNVPNFRFLVHPQTRTLEIKTG